MDQQPDRYESVEAITRLLIHLSKKFCEVNSAQVAEPEKMLNIYPAYFYGWLATNMPAMDQAETCRDAGSTIEAWEHLREVLDGGLAVERLQSLWYLVVLAQRPALKHPIKSVNLAGVIRFEDNSIFPLTAFLGSIMIEDGKPFTDGLLMAMLYANTRKLLDALSEESLEAKYEKATKLPDVAVDGKTEDPYNVFCGLVLQSIPALHPAFQAPVKEYLRLFQVLVRPPISPQMTAQIEARKREWAQKHGSPAKPAQGGWG